MKFSTQRRLAAELLDVGTARVWFDPTRLADITKAITKADIRDLIKEGAIKARPVAGVKKRAGRKRKAMAARLRPGKRKKQIAARKRRYVRIIRKLRAYLKSIKPTLSLTQYRHLRKLAKAGFFKSLRALKEHLKK